MAWTAPKIDEKTCGMKVNMDVPASVMRGGRG